jgi:hypothetical protein
MEGLISGNVVVLLEVVLEGVTGEGSNRDGARRPEAKDATLNGQRRIAAAASLALRGCAEEEGGQKCLPHV